MNLKKQTAAKVFLWACSSQNTLLYLILPILPMKGKRLFSEILLSAYGRTAYSISVELKMLYEKCIKLSVQARRERGRNGLRMCVRPWRKI
jgi:hypothetical protein